MEEINFIHLYLYLYLFILVRKHKPEEDGGRARICGDQQNISSSGPYSEGQISANTGCCKKETNGRLHLIVS